MASWREDVRDAIVDLTALRNDLLRVARPKHARDVEDVIRRLSHALRHRSGETPTIVEPPAASTK